METFVPSEKAQADQIADLIKELYFFVRKWRTRLEQLLGGNHIRCLILAETSYIFCFKLATNLTVPQGRSNVNLIRGVAHMVYAFYHVI